MEHTKYWPRRGGVCWNGCAACCAYIKFSLLYQLVKNGMNVKCLSEMLSDKKKEAASFFFKIRECEDKCTCKWRPLMFTSGPFFFGLSMYVCAYGLCVHAFVCYSL